MENQTRPALMQTKSSAFGSNIYSLNNAESKPNAQNIYLSKSLENHNQDGVIVQLKRKEKQLKETIHSL
jgi:hypothetical protein